MTKVDKKIKNLELSRDTIFNKMNTLKNSNIVSNELNVLNRKYLDICFQIEKMKKGDAVKKFDLEQFKKNQSQKMFPTSVSLREYQVQWLEEQGINFSELVRTFIDSLIAEQNNKADKE